VGCCCAPGWRRLGRRGHRHRTCLYHSSMETIVAFARVRWVMSAPQLTHWETRTAITWRATSARTQGFHAAQQAVRRGGAVTIRSSQQLPVAPVLCGRKVLSLLHCSMARHGAVQRQGGGFLSRRHLLAATPLLLWALVLAAHHGLFHQPDTTPVAAENVGAHDAIAEGHAHPTDLQVSPRHTTYRSPGFARANPEPRVGARSGRSWGRTRA
jgi:hypothetical protein